LGKQEFSLRENDLGHITRHTPRLYFEENRKILCARTVQFYYNWIIVCCIYRMHYVDEVVITIYPRKRSRKYGPDYVDEVGK
jgi:hypothetical protein